MKLSVIVPAYNAEKTIRQSLDSILAQTRPVDELIVINDGSTDGTEKILQEYRDAYPDCFRFRTVENGGQGRARNIGFDLSSGDWIGYVDSDDWIDPEMYERLIAAAEREHADLVLCEVLAHFPDGSTARESIYREERAMAAAGFANNKLFRRSLIENVRFPEEKLWGLMTSSPLTAFMAVFHIPLARAISVPVRKSCNHPGISSHSLL